MFLELLFFIVYFLSVFMATISFIKKREYYNSQQLLAVIASIGCINNIKNYP